MDDDVLLAEVLGMHVGLVSAALGAKDTWFEVKVGFSELAKRLGTLEDALIDARGEEAE